MQAHILVSWLHPFKEQKLVVVGDRKMAVFNDTKPWPDKLWLYPHEIKWERNIPVPAKADPEKVDVQQQEPLRQECEHFLHCMATGEQPITDGNEGLRVLRVLKASQRSLDAKGTPFQLVSTSHTDRRPVASTTDTDYFAHDTAVIDDGVSIGKGTKIWHFSHVLKGSTVGTTCNIGQNVVIGPDVTIGNACKIQNNVSVYKGVTLEDGVFCGPSMVFTNIYNPRAEIRKMDQVRPTWSNRVRHWGPTRRLSVARLSADTHLWARVPWSTKTFRTMHWWLATRRNRLAGFAPAGNDFQTIWSVSHVKEGTKNQGTSSKKPFHKFPRLP